MVVLAEIKEEDLRARKLPVRKRREKNYLRIFRVLSRFDVMRIIRFDPYGALSAQSIAKDSRQNSPLVEKISEEIATNEAIRLALLAIGDREQEEKKQRHRYKLLGQKQAKVLLSQLRHVHLDFKKLYCDSKKKEDQEKDEKNKQKRSIKVTKKKKGISLGAAASQAIAAAAEAWVIARNKGVLETASTLFYQKDEEA
ncbi:Uncharacterized protein BN1224_CV14_A_03400 [Chlamydia pneumoniae]|uniref:Uncharacterized protein n=3 Tax=Chlamydia pneumoniae TaxID=83558 RepID=A0A0F7WI30_CHLPN|nr:Uncharacterized protein BN1224_Wien1_A_03380 [Chlamydia pneumoniae]CRI35694.1 Uncharacterized protein BN1224_CM1_A_03410 [Chlamydia pneumoniae]CRI36821.1 Uncharacterized protein BN1224_CV14_A_03400 [Chlamydia pneumoniae]CRI37944.1 Uncharacterized protein BN1224_CV15_B_02670 [Chlamydia pneumoniae]CRI39079.1 Uncharacterized protein BN1224_CWL011_A_03430 [Chlamydia pneumoniae]